MPNAFNQGVRELFQNSQEQVSQDVFLFSPGGPGCALLVSHHQAGYMVVVLDLSSDLVLRATNLEFQATVQFGEPGSLEIGLFQEAVLEGYPISLCLSNFRSQYP